MVIRSFFTKKLLPLYVIFFFSLGANLLFFDWQHAPILYPDSDGYLRMAHQIRCWELPRIDVRTPVYSAYLAMFGEHLLLAALMQTVIGAFSSVFLYLINVKLFSNVRLALLISLFLAPNYEVICWQSIIHSECLAVFFFAAVLYLHILNFNDSLPQKKWQGLQVAADLLLIFTKPTFVALPIGLYLAKILYRLSRRNGFDLKFLVSGLTVNVLLILAYCSANFYQNQFFGFSMISDLNTTGKLVRYGYFEPEYVYENPPEVVRLAQQVSLEFPHIDHPWTLRERLAGVKQNTPLAYKEINNYVLAYHKLDYVARTLHDFQENFVIERHFFNSPSPLVRIQLFRYWENAFDTLNKWGLITSVIFLLVILVKAWKKQWQELTPVSLVYLSIFYTVFMISVFSFGDFSRLRAPCEPFLLSLSFYLMAFVTCVLPGRFLGIVLRRALVAIQGYGKPTVSPRGVIPAAHFNAASFEKNRCQ